MLLFTPNFNALRVLSVFQGSSSEGRQERRQEGRRKRWRRWRQAIAACGYGAQGARLGARRHPLRHRHQLQRQPQGPLQDGHAPLGEQDLRQVRRAQPQRAPQLHPLHRETLWVSNFQFSPKI